MKYLIFKRKWLSIKNAKCAQDKINIRNGEIFRGETWEIDFFGYYYLDS